MSSPGVGTAGGFVAAVVVARSPPPCVFVLESLGLGHASDRLSTRKAPGRGRGRTIPRLLSVYVGRGAARRDWTSVAEFFPGAVDGGVEGDGQESGKGGGEAVRGVVVFLGSRNEFWRILARFRLYQHRYLQVNTK